MYSYISTNLHLFLELMWLVTISLCTLRPLEPIPSVSMWTSLRTLFILAVLQSNKYCVWCLMLFFSRTFLPSASGRCHINKQTFFLTLVLPVSLAKVDGGTVTKCNFAGDEKAGASWTDKIMANKSDSASAQTAGGEGEGAGEDEWVRTKPNLPHFRPLNLPFSPFDVQLSEIYNWFYRGLIESFIILWNEKSPEAHYQWILFYYWEGSLKTTTTTTKTYSNSLRVYMLLFCEVTLTIDR